MGTGPWERLTRAAILILLFAGRGDLFSSRTRASLRATLTSVAHAIATWDSRRIASILYDFPDEYTHMVMGGDSLLPLGLEALTHLLLTQSTMANLIHGTSLTPLPAAAHIEGWS